MDSEKRGKAKILFIRKWPSSFIQNDLKILKKHFNVKVVDFSLDIKDPKNALKTVFGMISGIIWTDIVFSWFASGHSCYAVKLSKIFKKKSVVVVGGFDVVVMPEINYGLALNPKFIPKLQYILKNADKLIAFSNNSAYYASKYLNTSKVEVVYLGIERVNLNSNLDSLANKDNLVITVSYLTKSNLQRKGLETFVKAAKYVPDTNFVLIGQHKDDSINYLKSIAPSNLRFTGYVSDDELADYYKKAKVYVQVSAHEGFGLAMAEAMAFGCVPVVTDRGAIKEVVGDTGFYVEFGDFEETANAIKDALKSDKGKKAKRRVETKFTMEKREIKLLEIMNSLNG